jgi:hypothetical protein
MAIKHLVDVPAKHGQRFLYIQPIVLEINERLELMILEILEQVEGDVEQAIIL